MPAPLSGSNQSSNIVDSCNRDHRHLAHVRGVRGTAAEARATCNANHSDFRSNPGYSGAGARWYSDHVPEGYSAFAQFVNGYEYYVP